VYTSFLLIAIVTERAILFNPMDHWKMADYYHSDHINWEYTDEVIQKLKDHGLSPFDLDTSALAQSRGMYSQPWENTVRPDGSAGEAGILGDNAWVEIKDPLSRLYQSTFLMHDSLGSSVDTPVNPWVGTQLEALGIDPQLTWLTSGCLMHFLFQPKPNLIEAAAQYDEAFQRNKVVAIHVRMVSRKPN